jgi:hypothetical protein
MNSQVSGARWALFLVPFSACASIPEQEAPEPAAASAALEAGLGWLARNQSSDGSWVSDGTWANARVGTTALAVLALLGDPRGSHADAARAGMHWLLQQQDQDSGLIGRRKGHDFMYSHAIATYALCTAPKDARTTERLQRAVDFILKNRNPCGGWRYSAPPDGENDTSVTGWMVCALDAANRAGLSVDENAFVGALAWFDEATDPETGRVGYDSPGSYSSRITGLNDHYPVESGEAMTAEALRCRLMTGRDARREPSLLMRKLPEWDPEGKTNDMYYWYHGSFALQRLGDERTWSPWKLAMRTAALSGQRADADERGSWDPKDPWAGDHGRAYSTALMCLCLEAELS